MYLNTYSKLVTLILSTFGCMLLTPFIIMCVAFLAILAVFTSAITSSFIFLRLAFMTIRMESGLTIESTYWLLSVFLTQIRSLLISKTSQNQPPTILLIEHTVKRRRLPPSSISLSRLPYKAQVKSMYSLSVPTTPQTELYMD